MALRDFKQRGIVDDFARHAIFNDRHLDGLGRVRAEMKKLHRQLAFAAEAQTFARPVADLLNGVVIDGIENIGRGYNRLDVG